MKVIFKNILFIQLLILSFFSFFCGTSNNRSKIEASGTIETTEVTISSKVSGELQKLFFDEGDEVHQNDTIAEIDKTNLLIQKKQAEGGLLLADAQLKISLNASREEDIRQSEEALKQAKANFESAELDKNRMDELHKSKSISEKQWDDVLTRHKITQAQYKSAEEFFKKVKKGARIEDIESARARKIQSESQLDLINQQIDDSHIVSPIDGLLSHKVFEVGELVMTGSNLFIVSRLDKVYLMLYVNEIDLGRVKLGQKDEVKIDSYPDKIFNGKVTYISSTAEFTPKNIQSKEDRSKLVFGVKVEINNPEKILKPGIPADATIITSN